MRIRRVWGHLLAGVAVIVPLLPAQWVAADPTRTAAASAAASPIVDVELAPGGLLVGRLVDAEGRPLVKTDLAILCEEKVVASTRSDAHGVFAVAGLRGGLHQIRTDESLQLCRLWTNGTAPPQAPTSVELVAGSDVIRGQWGPPPGNGFLQQAKVLATNPFVVGGVVAAAVAIPIALSQNDGPRS